MSVEGKAGPVYFAELSLKISLAILSKARKDFDLQISDKLKATRLKLRANLVLILDRQVEVKGRVVLCTSTTPNYLISLQ